MIQIQKPHSVLSKNKPEKFLHFHKKKYIYTLPLVSYSLKNNTLLQQKNASLLFDVFKPNRLVCHPVKKEHHLVDKKENSSFKISDFNSLFQTHRVTSTTTPKNKDYKQKISLKKRKVINRTNKSKRKIKGILGKLYISSTKNNTILTLIDTNNNTKGWNCSGSLGFKNARKSTTYAAQAAAESMVKKAKIYGYTHLRLLVKGLGRGKQSCLRALSKSGLKIISLEDQTAIPYNGCRASKKRRV